MINAPTSAARGYTRDYGSRGEVVHPAPTWLQASPKPGLGLPEGLALLILVTTSPCQRISPPV